MGGKPRSKGAAAAGAGDFFVVLADPPWSYSDRGSRMAPSYAGVGRKEAHYQVMPLSQVKAMGGLVKLLAAREAFLFLWVPNALVGDGLEVVRSWGFDYKTMITWVKTDKQGKPRIGGGHYTRGCTEQLLLGRRGTAEVKVRNIPNVIMAPRQRHSAKPDESYRLIEKLCRGPYLELFARRRYGPKWAVWGDQLQDVDG